MTLRYRPLGGTGMQVSTYCLGTMMFGADGNADHDECARIIHAALDAGRYRMGVLTWSPLGWGFLTGRIRRGAAVDLAAGRAAHNNARFDLSLPENQRKLDAVESLVQLADDLGCTPPQLAVAFPLAHPAVTSVILGPRALSQLEDLLAGFFLELGDPALDRIDEIVPPGTDLVDLTWKPPALTDPALRRRLTGQRAAGE